MEPHNMERGARPQSNRAGRDLAELPASGRVRVFASEGRTGVSVPEHLLNPRAHVVSGPRAEHRGGISYAFKRALDILGALFGLILLAPIMLLASILIWLEGNGPVLFRQERVGREGRRFLMVKFRTMCPEAEALKARLSTLNEMSGPVFKVSNDPRVTPLGRFLRKYSIDELPQLFHVLSGKLSLVGPRPALPEEVVEYEPWQRHRLTVKPGLTCLWQVSGRNQLDFADWMRLDLEYVQRRSLWLDLWILLKTIPTVLKGTGV